MPKETKKEVKKSFPLYTTAQSNAYKEQVKVDIPSLRNKERLWWWDPTSNFSRSPKTKPSQDTCQFIVKTTKVSNRPTNWTSYSKISTPTIRKPREIGILIWSKRHKSRKNTSSLWLLTSNMDGESRSTPWVPTTEWSKPSTSDWWWLWKDWSRRPKNDSNIPYSLT